jgi:AraC-like DNA-binding protein
MLRAMGKKSKTYTPAPTVPEGIQARYLAVMGVMSGQTTVSDAAQRLGMSRNHFQTLLHRAQEGMVERLTPGTPGRPAKSEREAELERELAELKRKQTHLEQRLEMTDKVMGLAKQLLHGPVPRARSKRTKADKANADDDDTEPRRVIARELDKFGLPRALVARVLAYPESTLRRWCTTTPTPRPSPYTLPRRDVVESAIAQVRELRGLVGANTLRTAHPGLSRRQAQAIKDAEVTALERERKARCRRVAVTAPGIVRGFDAMDVQRVLETPYVLAAADAAVPFRTSLSGVERYDGAAVAAALERDFAMHGAPYVLRMDRAKAHQTLAVRAVLAHFGVLALHGPPHHPRFYGQLERQNREHRAWLEADVELVDEDVDVRLERMRRALNERWKRPSLRGRSAAEAWEDRPQVHVCRARFADLVATRRCHLLTDAKRDKLSSDLAERLAIEQVLTSLGWLRVETRDGC